jgi:hypothetical protein
MCSVQALITNSLLCMTDGEVQEETLTFEFVSIFGCFYFRSRITYKHRARKEHRAFQKLLQMVPRLTERLMEASDEESMMVADLVCLTVALRFNPVSHPLLDSKRYIWCEV